MTESVEQNAAPDEAAKFKPRSFLVMKALLLFMGISGLLLTEVVLGVQLGRQMEQAADDLASIDRQGQSLLLAASKINDMLYDLTVTEYSPQDANSAMLAHLHTHIVALTPLENEIIKSGRRLTHMSVSDLLALSTEVQVHPTMDAAMDFARTIRPTVEELSNEALGTLVAIEEKRDDRALWVQETRARFWRIMVAIGVGGALAISTVGLTFFMNLVRDLREIREKAVLISEGDYSKQLSEERTDELGALIRAVNQLSKNLSARTSQIDELRGRFAHQEKLFALGMFATGMAHEIGNPIQAISALADQIQSSLSEDASPANVGANIALIRSISDQIERLTRSVRDIREFAHPGKAEPTLVDVNEVVRNTINLMRFDPRFKSGKLSLECTTQPSTAHAVPDHLVQMLMNLLINAADATAENGGTIKVSTARQGDMISIEVRDTGAGMPADVLEKAQEPFFTTKPRNRGTGLGLSICRSIIEEHRGSMRISSIPGLGTSVTIAIPGGAA